jgi:hypothetical protein
VDGFGMGMDDGRCGGINGVVVEEGALGSDEKYGVRGFILV